MSKRKLTDTQKLIAFGMAATLDALNAAIESLIAIRDARFTSSTKPPRKLRSDAGKARESSKSNGADDTHAD